jgi:hypothetical protein
MVDELGLVKEDLPAVLADLSHFVGDARVGVVTFGDAILQVLPLEADWARLAEAAARLEPEQDPSNRTIEEAVHLGLESAFDKRLGWRKKATRVLVLVGDAPPPREALDRAGKAAAAARAQGFVLAFLLATPPESYKAKADPGPAFLAIAASAGGAPVVPLAEGESPGRKLVRLALGVDEETGSPLLDALEALRRP